MNKKLTHFDESGRAKMVDVSNKAVSSRRAKARGHVQFTPDAYRFIREEGSKKGDIASIAEIAGIMGAKKTADLIPLCHPLPLTGLRVKVEPDDENHLLHVPAEVMTSALTGVEMEALTAVSVACLTIYDMAKAIDKDMTIGGVELIEKTGGASGDFKRG